VTVKTPLPFVLTRPKTQTNRPAGDVGSGFGSGSDGGWKGRRGEVRLADR